MALRIVDVSGLREPAGLYAGWPSGLGVNQKARHLRKRRQCSARLAKPDFKRVFFMVRRVRLDTFHDTKRSPIIFIGEHFGVFEDARKKGEGSIYRLVRLDNPSPNLFLHLLAPRLVIL